MKFAPICLILLCLAGCSKNIDNAEAVKEGVIKDIAGKVDVGSMDVSVDSVSFREKEADAQVSFRPKGSTGSQAIVMNYSLERQGDEWHIKNRSMQSPHEQETGGAASGQNGLPAGHPHVDAGQNGLPAGHPQVDPGQNGLPAGHPHVDPSQKP